MFIGFLCLVAFFLLFKQGKTAAYSVSDAGTYDGFAHFVLGHEEEEEKSSVIIKVNNLREASLISGEFYDNYIKSERCNDHNCKISYIPLTEEYNTYAANAEECTPGSASTLCSHTISKDYLEGESDVIDFIKTYDPSKVEFHIITNVEDKEGIFGSIDKVNAHEIYSRWYKSISTDWKQATNGMMTCMSILLLAIVMLAVWPTMSVQEPNEFPNEPENSKEEE